MAKKAEEQVQVEVKKEWTNEEIDAHVNELVENAQKALDAYLDFDQDKVDYIVAKCSVAGLDAHGTLAEAAVNETKRGVFEDKAVKNLFACGKAHLAHKAYRPLISERLWS